MNPSILDSKKALVAELIKEIIKNGLIDGNGENKMSRYFNNIIS
jgi:hypothetical protein